MTVTAVPIPPTKRSLLYILWAGIVVAVLGGIALATLAPADFLTKNARRKGVIVTATGLQYQVLKPGRGDLRPTDADIVLLNYEGRLLNGQVFDKSQQPTPLSPRQVIPGFGEALKLMQKGGKYRVWIKPSLGYGDKATGPIPANATLVFDIDVIDFLPEAVLQQRMMQMQQMQQMQGLQGQGGTPPR